MTKAIIIAAGKGTRLEHMTENLPKCLLDINGKSILDNQLEAYRECHIEDIALVKGYKQEKINKPGLTYYINDNYENNNILLSLMYAQDSMKDGFIASYSDIVFESSIVRQLIDDSADISIVVDTAWLESYENRADHPPEEAEKVIINDEGFVKEIGKEINNADAVSGEFLGLFKCSGKGAETFIQYFNQAKESFEGEGFITAKEFQRAYITDFIQYLVNEGVNIKCVTIEGGWHEVDTIEDIQLVRNQLAKETI